MPTLKDHIAIVKEFNSWRQAGQKEFGDEGYPKRLGEALDAVVLAAENSPDLEAVIKWLENGCDSKEAVEELKIYQRNISGK